MKRISGHTFIKPTCRQCKHFKCSHYVKKTGTRYRHFCTLYRKDVPCSGLLYPNWCKDKFELLEE
jgi:hypothetical protein